MNKLFFISYYHAGAGADEKKCSGLIRKYELFASIIVSAIPFETEQKKLLKF